MEDNLICNDPFNVGCTWSGDSSELVATDDDSDSFIYCPNCEGTDFEDEDE